MEYVLIGVTLFVALILAFAVQEAYFYFMKRLEYKKTQEAYRKFSDKIIARYAQVDEIDDVVKEWRSE